MIQSNFHIEKPYDKKVKELEQQLRRNLTFDEYDNINTNELPLMFLNNKCFIHSRKQPARVSFLMGGININMTCSLLREEESNISGHVKYVYELFHAPSAIFLTPIKFNNIQVYVEHESPIHFESSTTPLRPHDFVEERRDLNDNQTICHTLKVHECHDRNNILVYSHGLIGCLNIFADESGNQYY